MHQSGNRSILTLKEYKSRKAEDFSLCVVLNLQACANSSVRRRTRLREIRIKKGKSVGCAFHKERE